MVSLAFLVLCVASAAAQWQPSDKQMFDTIATMANDPTPSSQFAVAAVRLKYAQTHTSPRLDMNKLKSDDEKVGQTVLKARHWQDHSGAIARMKEHFEKIKTTEKGYQAGCKLLEHRGDLDIRKERCPFAAQIGPYDTKPSGSEFRFCEKRREGREYELSCNKKMVGNDPEEIKRVLKGKRIVFVGDSQIEQQFLGTACLLWEHRLIDETATKKLKCVREQMDGKIKRNWGCDWQLDLEDELDLKMEYNRVFLAQRRPALDPLNICNGDYNHEGWVSCGITEQLKLALKRSNVAVATLGGHYLPEEAYNDGHGTFQGAWQNLQNDVKLELDTIKEHLGGEKLVLWSEMSPTHGHNGKECTNYVDSDFSNVVNARTVPAALEAGAHIVPVNDILMDHAEAHLQEVPGTIVGTPNIKKFYDCNHLCAWPGLISASSKRILQGMDDFSQKI